MKIGSYKQPPRPNVVHACSNVKSDALMPSPIAILSSLLVGLAATLGTIVIHGFAVHTIIMTLRRNLQRGVLGRRICEYDIHNGRNAVLRSPGILWRSHFGVRAGAVGDISTAIYSSAGSYTTTGSDIVLPPRWKVPDPKPGGRNVDVRPLTTAFIFAATPAPASMTRINLFLEGSARRQAADAASEPEVAQAR